MTQEEFLYYLRQFLLYTEGVAAGCKSKSLEAKVHSFRATINQFESSQNNEEFGTEEVPEEDKRAAKLAAKIHAKRNR